MVDRDGVLKVWTHFRPIYMKDGGRNVVAKSVM